MPQAEGALSLSKREPVEAPFLAMQIQLKTTNNTNLHEFFS